jgi:hypothetical protein
MGENKKGPIIKTITLKTTAANNNRPKKLEKYFNVEFSSVTLVSITSFSGVTMISMSDFVFNNSSENPQIGYGGKELYEYLGGLILSFMLSDFLII